MAVSGRKTVAVLRIKKCGDCPFLDIETHNNSMLTAERKRVRLRP